MIGGLESVFLVVEDFAVVDFVLEDFAVVEFVLEDFAVVDFVLEDFAPVDFVVEDFAVVDFVLEDFVVVDFLVVDFFGVVAVVATTTVSFFAWSLGSVFSSIISIVWVVRSSVVSVAVISCVAG